MHGPRTHAGFTVTELLLVVLLIALLSGTALFLLLPDPTRSLAQEITQLHQQARFESINRNEVLLSTWNHNTSTWQISVANPSNRCTPAAALRSSSTYRNVDADTSRYAGILWQPNGLPLSCTGPGQPVAQQQLTLYAGRRTTTITFSSNGRGAAQ